MKVTKKVVLLTINVPEEIRERLKLEPNQSELVSKLLLNYFQDIGIDKIEEQISLLKSQKDLQAITLDQRISELQKRLEEKRNEEIIKEAERIRAEKIKKWQEEAITEI